VDVLWPSLQDGRLWIEAQVLAESAGDPKAESPSGAQGLLQLMPGTAAELGVANPFDPTQNLNGGVKYLRKQFEALSQVPNQADRLYWAFASFNAGRGYVVKALALAAMDKALPGAEHWWSFHLSWRYLAHRQAALSSGRWADYHQVVQYVGRIQAYASVLGAKVQW
jgi:soluble lytic murein transglycosylase-like protein